MKLTNKHNIPETFVNVLKRPTYSKGKAHLSATQLLNSPKIVALTKKFEDELEQDVADMVWSIFGTAIHGVLEHGKDDNHLVEERLHATIDGWRISGAIDLQILNGAEGIAIRDYKTTSAWAVMNEKIEWERQLNIYAWLLESVKTWAHVTDLGIVAIIRDWSRREAAKNPDYPQAPVKDIPIKLWPFQEREDYVAHRVKLHSACEFSLETGEDLPDCTPEEMWERPTTYAIKKKGGIRAIKVYEVKEEAAAALDSATQELEVRLGSRTRCESFCPVNTYCQQWRDYQENMK